MNIAALIEQLRAAGQTVATAESLTGGLLCAALVDVPGASDVVRGGVVAYQAEVKTSALGVPAELIAEQGTVAGDVAAALARGARERFDAGYGVSTTGVAGPGPSEGKPAGAVFVAVAGPVDEIAVESLSLPGDRAEVREGAVYAALTLLSVRLREQCGQKPC